MIWMEREFVYSGTATLAALLGAGFDLKSRRIPNLLTGPAFLAGVLLHLALDGWRGGMSALGAGVLCGLVFVILYMAGGMGAGDVKLMAAAGALAGMPNVASLLLLTALAGGVMAVALALMRGRLMQTLRNVVALTAHHHQAGLRPHPELNVENASMLRLPYGVAIAAGCSITFCLFGLAR